MKRLSRILYTCTVGLTLAAIDGPFRSAGADEARPLAIGNQIVAILRTGDTLNGKEWSVADRINHVQDVIAKHLGGRRFEITGKALGERVHVYVNGDFTLAVTPADAKATGFKSAKDLAPKWRKALLKALDNAGNGGN